MKLFSLLLALVCLPVFAFSATPTPTPKSSKPRKFTKPPCPEIRITNAVANNIKIWSVEVVKGSLEMTNGKILKQGQSISTSPDLIVWRMGQIVWIGEDGVVAGNRRWDAGTKLFVDDTGNFYAVAGRSPADNKPQPTPKITNPWKVRPE